MSANPHQKRRDFLKTAAAGTAGAIGLTGLKFDKVMAQSTGGWVSGMQINPAIDNKRVICCHDTKMLSANPASQAWSAQNANVNAALVASNLDQMAIYLTQKSTAAEAWSTIFRSSKPWASTRVAMKTNGIGGNTTNRPRWAIYKKICDVLIDLGVQPANIILYDACDDASTYYNAYTSLTDATKIRAASTSVRAAGMGGFKAANLTNATDISVSADLASGAIDILVNVAACKSHNGTGGKYNYGSCTLCMKNHFGTFTSGTQAQHSNNLHVGNSGASPPPAPLALFEINKHSAVLGGSPVRQQLCIVDALLSNGASGPGGGWDNRTDRLVMGTFAPFVDYFAVKKILLNTAVMTGSPMPALGVTNAAIIVPQFLTAFDYAETDATQYFEYVPGSPPPDGITGGGSSNTGGSSGSGGSSGTGGSPGTGGTSGTGGKAGTGGKPATGGVSGNGGSTGSGGSSATGGSGSASGTGGSSASATGGSGSGGVAATGGTTTTGGTMSSGGVSGGTGGTTTSASSALGGSMATGGTTVASTATSAGSSTGCAVGGVGRSATIWTTMTAFGAVVAGKLWRRFLRTPPAGQADASEIHSAKDDEPGKPTA